MLRKYRISIAHIDSIARNFYFSLMNPFAEVKIHAGFQEEPERKKLPTMVKWREGSR
jgi:hypothetical protein